MEILAPSLVQFFFSHLTEFLMWVGLDLSAWACDLSAKRHYYMKEKLKVDLWPGKWGRICIPHTPNCTVQDSVSALFQHLSSTNVHLVLIYPPLDSLLLQDTIIEVVNPSYYFDPFFQVQLCFWLCVRTSIDVWSIWLFLTNILLDNYKMHHYNYRCDLWMDS